MLNTKIFQIKALRCYVTAVAKTKLSPNNKFGQQLLISCKRPEFNIDRHVDDSKFGSVPLASNRWQHRKSKGDFFIINSTQDEEQRQTEMLSLDTFLQDNTIEFNSELIKNLKTEFDIKQLTYIQSTGIPKIFTGDHTIIAAETGCGKTLTYLLPVVQKIIEHKKSTNMNNRKFNTPLSIILTPGRELATQIGMVAEKLCKGTDIKIETILGGNTKKLMMNPEFKDVDIVIATFGALSKLVTTGIYRTEEVQCVVLDEADTLLDDSFSDKLCHFLKKFPFHLQNERSVGTQMLLASATMPTNITELLHKVIDVTTIQEVVSPNLHKLQPNVEQRFLRMNKGDRPSNLLNLVKRELSKNHPLLIFSNKSATSDYISLFLNNSGVNCLNLNGDMLMKIRLGRFEQFQQGMCDVLSTTDIGSRGLDTQRAQHVINFDFPLHVSDYIHRCGRIGRVGNFSKSVVTNFISSGREIGVVQRIEHAARTGGLLPNVNANIKGIINKQILKDMEQIKAKTTDDFF
ncbi:probable ATP-dependent RNA helicase DDX28 [Teleopsis dalmanni]|uniref:probable ATP-dependent RNA helicase DDX28 n=1 Tax=Teleopsis dalmanni TaxID=139649 RepID=UPI0018CD696C|nr:probable ATP-dependent RNA helicase DDX28 [Teleopsis dalmanni]